MSELKPGPHGGGLSVEDRLAIQDTLARYAIALDNNDWDAYRLVFTEDAIAQFTDSPNGTMSPPLVGLAAIIDQVASSSAFAAGQSDHHTVNSLIWRDASGTVRGWSHYITTRPDCTASRGEYLDLFVQTRDGWRIQRRLGNVRTKYGAQPRDWYGPWWLSAAEPQ